MNLRVGRQLRLIAPGSLGDAGWTQSRSPDLLGSSDPELLAAADADHRVVVSADAATLPASAAERVESGAGHAGVVLVSPERFSLTRDAPGLLIEALGSLGRIEAGRLRDRVVWLEPGAGHD